jgi:hypothetical protein
MARFAFDLVVLIALAATPSMPSTVTLAWPYVARLVWLSR